MKLSPDFLISLSQSLGWTLLHSIWQGALAGCTLLLVLRLLARRSASLRHAACMLAMAALAALSVFTAIRVQGLPGGNPGQGVQAFVEGAREDFIAAQSAATAGPPAAASNAAAALDQTPFHAHGWRRSLDAAVPWIAAAWLFGVSALLARRLLAWRTLCGWQTRGVEARWDLQERFGRLMQRFGVCGKVLLLESAEVATPMLAGIFRPVVILPLRVVTGLDERQLEAILVHELAHFVRHDAWWNLAQIAFETVFFYHPVVWWMGHCARQEREHAADDLALGQCADRRVYAAALGQLAELSLGATGAVAASGGNLLERIRRIVKPLEAEPMPGAWSLGVPTLICVVAIALLVRVDAQNAPAVQGAAAPASQAPAPAAQLDAKAWVADAFQLEDAAKRQAAIERIRQAMTGGNADEARAGISAFVQLGAIQFDKAAFLPAVRVLLESPDAVTRSAAAKALVMTGAEPQDVARVLAMVDDPAPEVRQMLSWIIMQLHRGDLTGPGGEAVLKLLSANDPGQLREALRGIWGAKFSSALETKVIALTQNLENANGTAYDAMYYALSTQANKSEASVRRLIELLAHQDTTNVAGRCAWGLQQGVAKEQFGLVANAMVKVIEARSEGGLRTQALRNLERYGNSEQVPAVRALLAKPGVDGALRAALEKTLAGLERAAAVAAQPAQAAPGGTSAAIPGADAEKSVRDTQIAELVAKNRQAARARANQDRQRYTAEQLEEIETLYQVANTKGKRSEEARESLKQLLEKYDGANRTGCALLYLGQASTGAARLEYLTRAVEKFSDCYYFNGCQVGGYGRYVLALTLWENGEKDKSRKLFEELKTTYKDATGHNGRPMSEFVEAAEKELAKQP